MSGLRLAWFLTMLAGFLMLVSSIPITEAINITGAIICSIMIVLVVFTWDWKQ